VVFTSERIGNPDLWVLDLVGGGEPRQLTTHWTLDDGAAFAPDGRSLAFVSTRDGDADIFVVPFDIESGALEGDPVNLTRRPGGDFNPAFSPDGTRIAYSRQDHLWAQMDTTPPTMLNIGTAVYVMSADGSGPRKVADGGAPLDFEGVVAGSQAGSPAWSTDGDTIYYYRVGGEGLAIRAIRTDGSGDATVVESGLSPAVDRSGRIVFRQPRPEPGMDPFDALRTGALMSTKPDGTDLIEVSDGARHYFAPDVDALSGRIVAHGTGAAYDAAMARDGFLFQPPGATSRVELPDRTLEMRGVRGYFPAITPEGDIVSTPLHEGPPVPLRRSAIDGTDAHDVFQPTSGAAAWGAAIARGSGWMVLADGPPFASGTVPSDIWKLRVDGSEAVNLTADVDANDALPHISDDGSTIVFRSGGDHGGNVYALGADGQRFRLTEAAPVETMPALSPDGERVVFPVSRPRGMKLWIQRLDGSEGRFVEPERLEIPDVSMHPRFSPDGKWIVFTSDRGGLNDEPALTWFPQPYGDLWAVPADGGAAVRLLYNKWEDGPSDWGFLRLPGSR